jgi:dynein heavy chain
MRDPFETIDAVTAERFVEEGSRQLTGVTRFFRERTIAAVEKIAREIKTQIDEFKPKVPLMVALRKPGMQERHWNAISQAMGFEVNPSKDPNFTFSKVLDIGLMK